MSETWPEGWGRLTLDTVDSTSSEAMRRAQTGAALPLWVSAGQQTAARGRRGRPWAMPEGNFAASVILEPNGGPAQAALRSFTMALALHDALGTLGVRGLSLKWPNDVLLNEGKLAGILLESTNLAGRDLLCIGVGVNLAAAPGAGEVEPRAIAPVALDGSIAPETLLDHLAAAFARWEAMLTTQGFAPVRAAWLDRAARLGEPIVARLPNEEFRGRFTDIDPTGALVLTTAEGEHHLPAADVYF